MRAPSPLCLSLWLPEAVVVRGVIRLNFPSAVGLTPAGVPCEEPAQAPNCSPHLTWMCWSPGSACSSPGWWVWRPSLISCNPDLGGHSEHVDQDLRLGRGLQGKYLPLLVNQSPSWKQSGDSSFLRFGERRVQVDWRDRGSTGSCVRKVAQA